MSKKEFSKMESSSSYTRNFMYLVILTFCFWSIISCSRSTEKEEVDSLIKINKISERIMVVGLASDAVTAINTDDGIVIIDAGISYSLTVKYRTIIENEFKNKNFAYLINTHAHHDHTNGNLVFREAKIIGHENCLIEFTERAKNPNMLKKNMLNAVEGYSKKLNSLQPKTDEWNHAYSQKLRYQFAYDDMLSGNYETTIESTFNNELNFVAGDLNFNLIYFGKAHTTSDIIIHIPELKLLMTGDLFSSYGRPSISDDKIDNRCTEIVKILKDKIDNIEKIISGHGQVLTKEDLLMFIENIEDWKTTSYIFHGSNT